MFKKIFIASVLFTGIVSCGKSKAGFKYSQDVVAKERSLQPDIEATESKVERYVAAEQYDSIAVAGSHMELIVQQKMDEINKMPMPNAKGVAAFKAAIMRYFGFIKSMYTAYKDWGSATSEESRQTELLNIKKLVDEKDAAIGDMQTAQRKYADENGFKIEK